MCTMSLSNNTSYSRVVLKVIILILYILPSSNESNVWLVVIATVMVLFACKSYKNKTGYCGYECNCAYHKSRECCDKQQESCSEYDKK